jgi:hypothetical protein
LRDHGLIEDGGSWGWSPGDLQSWNEIVDASSEGHGGQPSVVESDSPKQIYGKDSIGPAYSSFAEAIEALPHAEAHIVEVVHTDTEGNVRKWWEVSESGLSAQAGHTEQKALARVELQPGETLTILGWHPPCGYSTGCHMVMEDMAIRTGADITYIGVSPTGEMMEREYFGGEGHIPKEREQKPRKRNKRNKRN